MGRRITSVGEIKTRLGDLSDASNSASVSFGGTTLYARNQAVLDLAVQRIMDAVLQSCGDHLVLARHSLKKLVSEKLGEELNRSVFGAIVGRLLCLGELESLTCISVNSVVFGTLVKSERWTELEGRIQRVDRLLRENGTASAREVQEVCFPGRRWGTYSGGLFILSHLAYVGRAVFIDGDLFSWPQEVEDALRKTVC